MSAPKQPGGGQGQQGGPGSGAQSNPNQVTTTSSTQQTTATAASHLTPTSIPSSSSKSHKGAIIGGIVGGVAGLTTAETASEWSQSQEDSTSHIHGTKFSVPWRPVQSPFHKPKSTQQSTSAGAVRPRHNRIHFRAESQRRPRQPGIEG